MKTNLYLALFLFSMTSLWLRVQSQNTISPTMKVSTSLGVTEFDESLASIFQFRGAIQVTENYSLGAFYSVSISEIYPASETLSDSYMDYWAAGGLFDYQFYSKGRLTISSPIMLGYGEIQMDNEIGDAGLGEANFFQIEPSVRMNFKIHENFGFDFGVGYRYISEVTYRNLNQSAIQGPIAYFGVQTKLFR